MNPDTKLLINIFSDANILSLNILENLLSTNCLINIFTNDTKKWKKETSFLGNRSRFSVLDISDFKPEQKSNYVIYCEGFIDKNNVYKNVNDFLRGTFSTNTKTLILLPFEVFDKDENSMIQIHDNLSIVYLGDLIGPRIDLDSDLLLPSVIREMITTKTLTLGVGEIFYPIFIYNAIKTINKWLFSFGPYGKEIFLLGSQISGSTFWQENEKLLRNIKLTYDPEIKIRIVPRGYEITTISGNIRFSLIETYKWLTSKNSKNTSALERLKNKKTKQKKEFVYPKFLAPLMISLSVIIFAPLITLLISFGSMFISYKEFVSGKDGNIENLLLFGKTFSVLTRKESELLSYIPILGRVYKEVRYASMIGERATDAAISVFPLVKSSSQLFNKILGDEIYDPSIISQSLKSGAGPIYQSISLMQIETENEASSGNLLANYVKSKIDFERLRIISSRAESLFDGLPSILGKGGSKTYLILFQNNMELRPTGGFIGSYGLITFDGGRMSNLTVNDVYSADGQLNGHVEPPTPIKDYLGEANWWLRDSNWDADFPTSAKRAEWFLNKEVAKTVDGVVAIDLSPIKGILKYTGSIFLPDFSLDINDKNLYEKTQSEVQDNFFPGTHKKASFLTALSRSLLSEVQKTSETKKAYILKELFSNLEERHVQIYLHDSKVQNDIASLNWSGSVSIPDCLENCYSDFMGLVEANVGVNKSNYFIKRSIKTNINLSKNEIDRKTTVTLNNLANPALGVSGRYKVYMRLLIPNNAELLTVNSVVGQNREGLTPEIVDQRGIKEVGVLVEVLGGQSKNIEFDWQTVISEGVDMTSYSLNIRKQAGVEDDPISISINGNGSRFDTSPKFALTKDGIYTYNTTLAKDFFAKVTWK